MKEKLVIKNFGPIKDAEFEFSRFNVLIGEQATGKSTVAKLLCVCRYFSFIVPDGLVETPYESSFGKGLEAWGLSGYIKSGSSEIYYENHHYILEASHEILRIEEYDNDAEENVQAEYPRFSTKLIPLSDEFKRLLDDLESIKPTSNGPYDMTNAFWTIPPSFFQNEVAKVIDNPFYLPTQRGLQSIFSIGKSSIANLSDSLFNQLAQMDGIARHFTNETYIEPLNIFYKNVQGHGYVRKANEGEYYSLFNAASGYQAIIPIVLALKYYTELQKKNKAVIIEEPELDVFPATQNTLVHYLSDKTNHSTVFLTTHSPYTLTSINNLMYAYQVGKINKEETRGIIEEKYWLAPDDVSAYMLNPDGTCENIFDKEEALIMAEKIDGISSEINRKFDDMLNIEFKKNELNS